MEPGANTTYVRYRAAARKRAAPRLALEALVNYRDYHATTHGRRLAMRVERVAARPAGHRLRGRAARSPSSPRAPPAEPCHDWYLRLRLAARGRARARRAGRQPARRDASTRRSSPARSLTCVLSVGARAALDGEAAWPRRRSPRGGGAARPGARRSPPRERRRPGSSSSCSPPTSSWCAGRSPTIPTALSVIAGYHWFSDWGRDTMIACPASPWPPAAPRWRARILRTFARFVDQGMLPNRFPGRRRDARVQHRRRHALVLRGRSRLLTRRPATTRLLQRALPRAEPTSSPGTRRARATASASTRRWAAALRASRACSSPGWTPRSATGW